MCGVAGVVNLGSDRPIDERQLRDMLAMIRHRGPDQFGIYLDRHVGLGNARLSIVDLGSGQQPIANEDGTLWIVFNGEIFNHVELRPELEARGHRFTTRSDTEVLLHLYEEYGPDCLSRLNGQFAFAIWDSTRRVLFMARDRLGVRPLFYTVVDGTLIFGSEIKAILADRRVPVEWDPGTLDQIFSFWAPVTSHSVFKGIHEVPPGHYLSVTDGRVDVRCYWRLDFGNQDESGERARSEQDYREEFEALLIDATQIRLRADVAVGAYLSGGLDSSALAAIVRRFTTNQLETFSISFSDPRFDESHFQWQMANALGTRHHVASVSHDDIGRVFPDVIWHAETPVLRTAPVPMFLLSRLVRETGYKVVLTGEGADEWLAGYDIFKEAKIRRFWARQPAATWRAGLLRRLYPDIPDLGAAGAPYLRAFFAQGLADTSAREYSHAIRWRNTRRTRRFFSRSFQASLPTTPFLDSLDYPPGFDSWGPLERAQYLESSIFLSRYLLSSQGDRMGMAHSVEGRFPFLDHRVVSFCSRLPSTLKLRALNEKYLLKQVAQPWLPADILRRPKRPYRAPIHRSLVNGGTKSYLDDVLSDTRLKAAGVFEAGAVTQLLDKVKRGNKVSEVDDMALAGIVSTQLVHDRFVRSFTRAPALGSEDDVKVCVGVS
jgi:asparagine synthase (glutamine-hydrolysing)